jgi:hypothetical protein
MRGDRVICRGDNVVDDDDTIKQLADVPEMHIETIDGNKFASKPRAFLNNVPIASHQPVALS